MRGGLNGPGCQPHFLLFLPRFSPAQISPLGARMSRTHASSSRRLLLVAPSGRPISATPGRARRRCCMLTPSLLLLASAACMLLALPKCRGATALLCARTSTGTGLAPSARLGCNPDLRGIFPGELILDRTHAPA